MSQSLMVLTKVVISEINAYPQINPYRWQDIGHSKESLSHGPSKSKSFQKWMPIPRLGQIGREGRCHLNESVCHGPFKSESFREWMPIPRWESLSNVKKTNLRLGLIGQNESVSHVPFKSESFQKWMPISRLDIGHSNELVSNGPFKSESF